MPKDFKGHIEPDDPRHVLWGAGGATWPTVPPFRFRLGNPIVHPLWAVLQNRGILMEPFGSPTHDDITWANIEPIAAWITLAWVWRHYDRVRNDVRWMAFFDVTFWPEAVQVMDFHEPGPANVDVIVDNAGFEHPTHITPGPWLGLWQVYYNETETPEQWPPWE
jgi:hypothetical protein